MKRSEQIRNVVKQYFFTCGSDGIISHENEDGSLSICRRLNLFPDTMRPYDDLTVTICFHDDGLLFETFMPKTRDNSKIPLIVPADRRMAVAKHCILCAYKKEVSPTLYLESESGRIMVRFFLQIAPTADLLGANELFDRSILAVMQMLVYHKDSIDECMK